ncbi:MAG TPA: 4-alpha-glucanotransferase [Candidatus Methanoculleus thermohydrogenotrophicum]|nr:4-alpha-glucanotransferase [Candidatus Methanoculleus thermohydrogenotrophicum]HOB17887.1 4-alpha-glucanotransferase [Candidatus Methanoculleus thermohydrogenotrophicum]HPZ38022.1 4-alpha-glucanotransferase [Candidatus Methanoculleus thermohydrogenotrophicum]HQC91274.1 4-alpha-glucanotransferase [Candidatus Methanoculleus thermohydrogenotrophicum]
MIHTRGSGVLLHITSLPSGYGIGDFGPSAYRFVDALTEARQHYWQILPLNPTRVEHASSPYYSPSAFGINTLLISPDQLIRDEFLRQADLEPLPGLPEGWVAYEAVAWYKDRLFSAAYQRFLHAGPPERGYEEFCSRNAWWLEDHALFVALKDHFRGQEWNRWPEGIRTRQPESLKEMRRLLADRIQKEKFLQYLAARQWSALHRYCTDLGVQVIGDIPIYVAYDSVDVWRNPEIFKLDEDLRPTVVAGVPPDIFSKTGQLWGNPVYDWPALRERGYDWWMRRIRRSGELYDLFRIDHFRAFADYYEIPAGDKTAEHGTWVDGPGTDFFEVLARQFPCFAIVAEDLGANTPAVQVLLDRFGFPGMKILLFAFGEGLPRSAHIPHNYVPNLICYTGTHDNNTARGWFEEEASEEDKQRFFAYIGREVTADEVPRELILLAMRSVARTSIIPMQDILGLGAEARMNYPSTSDGNWEWRMTPAEFADAPFDRLRRLTELCGRA